jgi:hypothetical protein
MVFNATFNNISVISWRSVMLEETGVHTERTTDLLQVTDKLYTEILLKVALNTIPLTLNTIGYSFVLYTKNICEVYTMIRLN